MYLFFDTETTGLPKNWKAPISDLNNWPRLVQFGWILAEGPGEYIDQGNYIIYPENFSIPSESSQVHGITTERAKLEGVELITVLQKFKQAVDKATHLVAHNMNFDEKVIGAELLRKDIPSRFHALPKLCTMESSTDYCKIPGYYGYKWPKLTELHFKLFGEDFENAHDAFADISATERCFWEMRDLGLI